MTDSKYILVVDDSPTQLKQMEHIIAKGGFNVRLATNGKEAIELIQESLPLLVVTDLQMPEMSGLELVSLIKQSAPSLPVILTTSQGSEDIASQALQQGAASYVPKRQLSSGLIPTIQQVLSVLEPILMHLESAKYTVGISLQMQFPSDQAVVPVIVTRVEHSLAEIDVFDEGERMQVGMAIHEALINAITHGNLEVSSELRQEDNEAAFVKMLKQRMTQPPFSERHVHVTMHASKKGVELVVRDEGVGFDPSQVCDPTDAEALEMAGGRGLLLINAFMDEVHFNSAGNEIRMTKHAQNV